jgi:SsrA-binding protein
MAKKSSKVSKKKTSNTKASSGRLIVSTNRRARHDFAIEKTYEAGIQLVGTEVKSLRAGRAVLQDGYVSVDEKNEIWIENIHIPEYAFGTWTNHAPKRKRKLLMHSEEILKLKAKVEAKGYTIIPLSLYFYKGRAKIEIGLAKGKHEWDKRQAIRQRQDNLEASRAMKYKEYM